MLEAVESKMRKSVEVLKEELSHIRTGRANAAILEQVRVSYYGSEVPVNQVANISVPEPRMLVIAPWEKTMLKEIEKAIMASDLGLTPNNDGEVIRIVLPELTEERRKEFVRQARQLGERARVAVRNVRRDANDEVKKQVKEGELSEDEGRRLQEQIQALTDRVIADIDQVLERKEQDILTV